MAIGDAYATLAEYKAEMSKTDTADDTPLTRQLLAVSRLIDQETGHFLGFNKDASDVARTYKPRWGGEFLDLGDDYYASVTSIAVDGVALGASDWELTPLNAANKPEAEPYRRIRHLTSSWAAETTVVVTGKAGWPAVPKAIVTACVQLTAILRMESPRATSRANEVGGVIATSRVGQSIVAELRQSYPNPAAYV